jgi:myosin heavy subunit
MAMDGLGLSSEDQGNVLSLLAAILCLGNTVFVLGEKDQTKIADESGM